MLASKDIFKAFRTAAWQNAQEMASFIGDVGVLPPAELVKLLTVLIDKSASAELQGHRSRCNAFQQLADKVHDSALFVPYVRALAKSDVVLRPVLVQLLPKVNSVAGHAELCQLLGAPDGDLRKAAANVLKEVAGKAAFDTLVVLVRDPNFTGRQDALDVLVPRARHQAIPLIEAVVAHGRPLERVSALRYLGDTDLMSKDVPAALKVARSALDDRDERAAAQAIVSVGAHISEDEFIGIAADKGDTASVAIAKGIVDALARYGSTRAVQLLAKRLRAGPNPVRQIVLDALNNIGSEDCVPILVEAVGHRHITVRTKAGEVLSNLCIAGKVDVARVVLWLLRSRDVNVRRMAVEIAKKVGDSTGTLAPKLLRFLRDEDWWVRERVTDVLIEMVGNQLTQHIVEYLTDPSDVVRRYAIGALVRLKDAKALGAVVRSAMGDADWWVREKAIEACGELGDPRAVPYLIQIMDRDPAYRLVILVALKKLNARDAAPRVAALLEVDDSDLRLAVMDCLDGLDERGVSESVKALANDLDFSVRSRARDLLVRWNMMTDTADPANKVPLLDRLLIAAQGAKADDLVIAAGAVPFIKRLGEMTPLARNVFTLEQVRSILTPHLTNAQLASLEQLKDVDFSYTVQSQNLRFRAHVFKQMTGISAVFRTINDAVPDFERLNLPPVVAKLGEYKNGLVLVGGPTGSGKSTTLAAIIDYINRTQRRHIVTIEDPIEVTHKMKQSLVNQRELGSHTRTFASALRSTLRQDPDVILVGEMRDLETIGFAVSAAETGHLVFGTVHTVSADTSVDRLVNAFPAGQQPQVRGMLADSIRAVICQHLLRRVDQEGRIAAVEIMINNDAIGALIRKGKSFQIPSVITTSREQGMQSMDSELTRLLKEGKVSPEEVYMKAIDKKPFETAITTGKIGTDDKDKDAKDKKNPLGAMPLPNRIAGQGA